jgi:hypothetical protein
MWKLKYKFCTEGQAGTSNLTLREMRSHESLGHFLVSKQVSVILLMYSGLSGILECI